MSATSLKPVIEKLESLFSSFNQKFYNGELQTPVITVSPDTTKGAYGWCTSWKAWSNLDPDMGSSFIRDATVVAFVANETISIIENAGLMGVPIPEVITKSIEVLKNKAEKEGG